MESADVIDTMEGLAEVAEGLTASSLVDMTGGVVNLDLSGEFPGIDVPLILEGSITDVNAALAVVPLYDVTGDPVLLGNKRILEASLSDRFSGGIVLWVPPGAALPTGDLTEFIEKVSSVAEMLTPGDSGEVNFSVPVRLRKTSDEGSYLSAVGGLASQWARFTNQVVGQYQLDSSTVHRLPKDSESVTRMIDFLVLVANGIRGVGESVEVSVDDTWVVYRSNQMSTARVIVAPVYGSADDAATIRKLLRAKMHQSIAVLKKRLVEIRMVTFVSVVAPLEDERVSIALRSVDPSLFADLDIIWVVADGKIKRIFGPKPGTVLARPNEID